LIKRHPIENQDMLVELLEQECHIETNQSVVSRDLRELGVVKHKHKERMIYQLSERDVMAEILHLAVLDVVHNESTIVVKTRGGFADYVGDYLDRCHELEILATLAGENVVFVAPKSTQYIQTIAQAVRQALYVKPTHSKE
jgi:transcriptional regulator of arginine metabolism